MITWPEGRLFQTTPKHGLLKKDKRSLLLSFPFLPLLGMEKGEQLKGSGPNISQQIVSRNHPLSRREVTWFQRKHNRWIMSDIL